MINQINEYYNLFPEEVVYLHIDKQVYKPGDDVWFKAYIVEPSSKLESHLSNTLNVQLVNNDGTVSLHDQFEIEDGAVNASIKLFDNSIGKF